MNENILSNKNCLITGATGGIGSEIAKQLAKKKCNLFLTSTNEKKLKKLKTEINTTESKIEINYQAGNLYDLKDMQKIIKKTRECYNSIDILINSAGVFEIKSLKQSKLKDFENSFNVNIRAPFLLCGEFSQDMVKKKWGRMVNLGSSSSYAGFKNGSIYCASKHAILGLSRSIHAELKEHNVRTFCISPGSTKTEMAKKSINQNFNTFLDPKEVAEFIVFLISYDKEMIIDEVRLNRMIVE